MQIAVVKQQRRARLDILNEFGMRQRRQPVRADHIVQGQRDIVADAEHHGIRLQIANANLWTLNVAENSDHRILFVGDAADMIDGLAMRLMIAVREVDARDIHAGANHCAQGLRRMGRGSNRGNYLGMLAIQA